MSESICLCGAQADYPHRADCPYPMFRDGTASVRCWEETLSYRKELVTLKARWSNACESCMGTGLIAYNEDVAGDGGSRMQMTEPCEDCLAQGKCPHGCGSLEWDEENDSWVICPICGYVEDINNYHWKW